MSSNFLCEVIAEWVGGILDPTTNTKGHRMIIVNRDGQIYYTHIKIVGTHVIVTGTIHLMVDLNNLVSLETLKATITKQGFMIKTYANPDVPAGKYMVDPFFEDPHG